MQSLKLNEKWQVELQTVHIKWKFKSQQGWSGWLSEKEDKRLKVSTQKQEHLFHWLKMTKLRKIERFLQLQVQKIFVGSQNMRSIKSFKKDSSICKIQQEDLLQMKHKWFNPSHPLLFNWIRWTFQFQWTILQLWKILPHNMQSTNLFRTRFPLQLCSESFWDQLKEQFKKLSLKTHMQFSQKKENGCLDFKIFVSPLNLFLFS